MPEGFFDPLPEGVSSKLPTRSGKFYDIEVYGDIYAEGGAISGDLDVTGDLAVTGNIDLDGTMTLAGSGVIRTAESGKRVEIVPSSGDKFGVDIYDGTLSQPGGVSYDPVNDYMSFLSAHDGDNTTEGTWLSLEEQKAELWVEQPSGNSTNMAFEMGSFVESSSPVVLASTFGINRQQQTVLFPNGGGASRPDLTWSTDENTGMRRSAADTIEFDSGGVAKFNINTNGVNLLNGDFNLSESGNQFIEKDGSGYLAIRNRVNSGEIYLQTDDSGGTLRTRMSIDTAVRFYDSSAGNTVLFDTYNGDQRSISFNGTSNNSIRFDVSLSQFLVYIGGTNEMILGTTGFTVPNVYNNTTGTSSANVEVLSGGAIRRVTSARKYKEDIEWAPWLADVSLRPVRYKKKEGPRYFYGFIADELADEDRLLGVFDDGEIEDYDTRAVLAVRAAKIDRLESRLEACNCAV